MRFKTTFEFAFILIAASVIISSCKKDEDTSAQPDPTLVTIETNKDGLTFEATTIDYVATAAAADVVTVGGVKKIKKGSNQVRIFKFTNTSTSPVIIKNAKSSCGCLVPTYPIDPILPGLSGQIEVRYDTQRIGVFTKTVTVSASGLPELYTLTVKGDVTE